MRKFYTLFFSSFFSLNLAGQNFTEVALQNGINETCGDCLYGGAVSFVDFNNDGLDDLTFTSE